MSILTLLDVTVVGAESLFDNWLWCDSIAQCRLSVYTCRGSDPSRQVMHPGTTVRQDCLEKNGLSVTEAARMLGVDRQTLSNMLNARSGVSPEMAVRLEKAFGTPAREWLIRQLDYELAEVMRRADKIEVKPFLAPVDKRRGMA